MILVKVLKDKKEYYSEVLNKLLDLSSFELDILLTMLESNRLEVNTDTREHIRKVLNKNKAVTNNYIKRLRTKGIFVNKEGYNMVYLFNPLILQVLQEGKLTYQYSYDNSNN